MSGISSLLARILSLGSSKPNAEEMESVESVLFSLASGIEANDSYTADHSLRVATGSVALAKLLDTGIAKHVVALGKSIGLPRDQLPLLRRAGLVHDIGKIGVPTEILRKPGPLTPEERKIIERHPLVGETICRPLKSFASTIPILRHHHEKLDGSGYPDGLKGSGISLLVQIVTVADVFDALTSSRTYRKPLSKGEAMTMMHEECRKGWWDRTLVEEYAKVIVVPS